MKRIQKNTIQLILVTITATLLPLVHAASDKVSVTKAERVGMSSERLERIGEGNVV